ncbi:hypothetical protein [Hyalangium versicolor]|uniref:hypothetical protein n=1 Tax=Hyalangium versicolor TaxID=2861190 RepID=UPI001CCD47F8|nr:hypothetical protein [Hyalangium versicolor]
MQGQGIEGRGADLDPSQRPGVPMELEPQPLAGAQVPVTPQHSDYPVMVHGGRQGMPPVFGTAAPPKGLSGVIRKVAYKYPDHWARHWMMLMMADRVDSWEHNLRRGLPVAAVLVIGGLTVRWLKR